MQGLVLQTAQRGHPPLQTLTRILRAEGGGCSGRSCLPPGDGKVSPKSPRSRVSERRDAAAAVAVREILLPAPGALK